MQTNEFEVLEHYESDRDRFLFHADATGAAAKIDRIGDQTVHLTMPAHGQSALSPNGGISHSLVSGSPVRYSQLVQFGACETHAEGTFIESKGAGAQTVVRASVTDVRVINGPSGGERPNVSSVEFQADRVAIGLKAVHIYKQPAAFYLLEATLDHMWIVLRQGAHMERIGIQLELHMAPGQTCEKANELRADETFSKGRLPDGYVLGSIVAAVVRGKQRYPGHVLVEKGLGKIYFGEMLVTRNSRRITMVRVEMGSQNQGDVTFGAISANGPW